ncbi:esterase-like activity of phytase family protein [Zooshikella marina]|uniref:esterase-like activity of phytase family protein n=1 Tax=Zooshikella ganghwensis TaxID=202772 RepID=UPI001BAF28EC|nr:esterase-like activity of phytase family protein [Zooshikella ganghwensis]MBU2708670.1 esterase-like activity of phytase family protein [Zooshikella ganghwensis]
MKYHFLSRCALGTSLAVILSGCQHYTEPAPATLVGYAKLPADSFAEGPVAGKRLGASPINGKHTPFKKGQPIQGFSAVLKNPDGTFLAMSDNGFGKVENSADFNLRLYTIQPQLKTNGKPDAGKVEVNGFIELHDPDQKIPFAIVNHFTQQRILTGADFDIESVRRTADGTYWLGDEFGPFILHVDANGKVLEEPYRLPDFSRTGHYLNSPQNPYLEEGSSVRIMNAAAQHAAQQGAKYQPVFSPYHVMLQDNNPRVSHYARDKDTPNGLKLAASDVFDIQSIQQAGYPVVTWTVNDLPRMLELMALGVDGIISDRPDLLLTAVKQFDGNKDGKPDYLTPEGLIDSQRFDAQGHRGGRNLRPENTLPAMEVALDNLMTTLETDIGITKDGVAVLSHDPYLEAEKCRLGNNQPYTEHQQKLIKNLTLKEIQTSFICDKVFRGDSQVNDPNLSPVTLAFTKQVGLEHSYTPPSIQQVFDFVRFYQRFYTTGAGKNHPLAVKRSKVAEQVRFNIETKLNPRSDRDKHGVVYKSRTVTPEKMATILANTIKRNGLTKRADIQSFDFRSLLYIQKNYPTIRTVYLIGDFPNKGPYADDGTNLQDEKGKNTPWLAGLYWPYRNTTLVDSININRSSGFEGMALSADGNTLFAMLEAPVIDSKKRELLIHVFDLKRKVFTGKNYRYPMADKSKAIGDFTMINAKHGLVIERDNEEGTAEAFKMIYLITLQDDGQVSKKPLVNLMAIKDPHQLADRQAGDFGISNGKFAFSYTTIENIEVLDEQHIAVMNDNNYPFSIGRHLASKQPDDTEFIVLRLPEKLDLSQ